MASIEFITKRIEGKQKEIKKLESKLSRIEKAKASGWENNPYYYDESDLKWTLKDLDAAKQGLAEWEKELATETEKANSRNVPAIIEFLDAWKARVTKHYTDNFSKYLAADKERGAENREYCYWMNRNWNAPKEEKEARRKEEEKSKNKFLAKWGYFIKYDDFGKLNSAKLKKDLDRDAELKYDDIIERTNFICGTITDASGLYVGMKGELDGYVIGDRGTAKVQTIGAGGYNIQCYHFRTLVHEVK